MALNMSTQEPSELSPQTTAEKILGLTERYEDIYVIVAPPRSASTAVARYFWQFPGASHYAHEAFESMYFDGAGLEDAYQKLNEPLALNKEIIGKPSLIIKEMPYQVGDNFPLLAQLAKHPLLFLIRHPRLTIQSRMQKKQQVGNSPIFPLRETGWELIDSQIDYAAAQGIPHYILDTTDFRNDPMSIATKLADIYQVPFSPNMLQWQDRSDIELDNLGGRHSHLYQRVLSSTGITPPIESMPDLLDFPEEGGFREHVLQAEAIYARLGQHPNRIR